MKTVILFLALTFSAQGQEKIWKNERLYLYQFDTTYALYYNNEYFKAIKDPKYLSLSSRESLESFIATSLKAIENKETIQWRGIILTEIIGKCVVYFDKYNYFSISKEELKELSEL